MPLLHGTQTVAAVALGSVEYMPAAQGLQLGCLTSF